ncbi:MAG: Ig-like domain-containing protein [Chitinispirillaceae bacterium]|nr:Ig-like domain-containing protein [Chitinispirillaceae bacterium]
MKVEKKNKYCKLIGAMACAFATCFLGVGCTENGPSDIVSEQQSSKIAGKVAASSGSVKILLEQGRPVDSAYIDPVDGYFHLDDIQPGTYRFKVVGTGFDTFSTVIKIDEHFSYELGTIFLAPVNKNDIDTIPSVYDHYPASGSDVIYLPPDKYQDGSGRITISVSFDRPMDRESVEKAFSIDPPVDGGYFVWYQNMRTFSTPEVKAVINTANEMKYSDAAGAMAIFDTMSSVAHSQPSAQISTYNVMKSFTFYMPRSKCYTDTTYTIRISRNALDTSGTSLDTALEFSFRTVQSAVSYNEIQMIPHNGDDWVSLISNGIQMTFPRRMNEEATNAAIRVNMKADPVFLWKNYNQMTIFTGGIFVPDTTYVITITTDALDIEGTALLSEQKMLSFRTEPIKIVQTIPARGTIGVSAGSNVTLQFNTYMDRTSFQPRFACVSSEGDTAEGTLNYQYSTYYNNTTRMYDTNYTMNRVVFYPSEQLKRNKLYTVNVHKGVTDLNGYALKEDYKLQFITMP